MAAVLGVSAHYHDAAAALVVDGALIAAVQEERLTRIKNDPSLPRRAMRACLSIAGLDARELDQVAYYENPYARLERVLVSVLRGFPRSFRQFPRAVGAQLGEKLWVLDQIAQELDIPRGRVVAGEHHLSHAASAFFLSPFERAAVLTVDGVGEEASTAIWLGEGKALTPRGTLGYPHSLGLLYAAVTAYLGFEVNEGEYKVMGLAAFGSASQRERFHRMVRVNPDASFELDLRYFGFATDTELGFSSRMEALLGPRRPPGRPWDLAESAEDRRFADVAATLQVLTEEILLGLSRRARELTGASALCLAGGVALNAVANRRLLAEAGFERVFVQPAAGDAGGALGAAVLGSIALGDPRPGPLDSAALGLGIDTGEARELARALGLRCREPADLHGEVARALLRDRVVAVARGRFEWGPRALGQRSLLALPRDSGMREQLNRVVKRREPFRPFAPAVLAEHASAYFEGAPNDMTPFMTTVCDVRPEREGELGAVRHVDGTARVQTVTAASSPALHAILGAVMAEGGAPVLLNTSLNGRGEPIVGSAADALGFFVSHGVDALLLGDLLVERGER